MFSIENLDHVAILVEDVEKSVQWYKTTLGLQRVLQDIWDNHPAMLFAGNTGVAIFPAKAANLPNPEKSQFRSIDHFAFRVTPDNFQKAQIHFKTLNQPFTYQDHIVYESIYTTDPDGHTVELTMLKKQAK
jgi:catechol 2,3-dioxygenase-like lactoylglutathione lyase family enzyme